MGQQAVITFLYKAYLSYQSIVTDSRNRVLKGIFFALRGPNFNGNAFAAQALAKGAVYAVIDEVRYKQDDRYILVADTLKTLQALARYHRQQLQIPIIAITGSNGKTTTKELIRAVLSQRYTTFATQGNLNNHIGVPLSLLAIDRSVDIAVIEMGANHLGEIAQYCQIALPTHGLITNIGPVHLEGFGSFEGVVRGKSELYNYLLQYNGQVFSNTTDPILSHRAKRFAHPILYPQKQDFYHCTLVEENPYVVYQSENGQVVSSQLLGKHHFNNIAAALCIAKYFKVDEKKANKAIKDYCPTNNRSQLIQKGTNTILLDAYNANPVSMQHAMRALHLLPAVYKVLILGDMGELGKESKRFHQEIVQLTAQRNDQEVILCGPQMKAMQAYNIAATYFIHKQEVAVYLAHRKFQDTAFLIKGARGLQLETLVSWIHS